MKNKLIHIISIPVTVYLFWMYVHDWLGMKLGYGLISIRPYVYRALVNWLVDVLMIFKVPQDIGYIFVMGMSLVGIIISTTYLYRLYQDDGSEWIVSYVGSWMLLLLLYKYPKPYDLMTVFLMTLGFIFISKNQHRNLAILFPFLCLNRETAFLLTLVCLVWFWRKMKLSHWMYMVLYQGIVFVVIQAAIRFMYQGRESMYYGVQALDNFKLWISHPVDTVLLVVGFFTILYFIFRDWEHKDGFLKVAFLSTFPVLLVLYVLVGYGYEVRVFAELYPIILILVQEKTHATQIQKTAKMSNYQKDQVPNGVWSKQSDDENVVTRFKL